MNPLTDSRQGTLHTETSILRITRPWRSKLDRQPTSLVDIVCVVFTTKPFSNQIHGQHTYPTVNNRLNNSLLLRQWTRGEIYRCPFSAAIDCCGTGLSILIVGDNRIGNLAPIAYCYRNRLGILSVDKTSSATIDRETRPSMAIAGRNRLCKLSIDIHNSPSQ